MKQRALISVASRLVWLTGSLALRGQGPVPRPAPELRIVESSSRITALSGYRGHVVLLAFISTQCGHCQAASQVFEQLSHEFANKLQIVEVAFDERADLTAFTRHFGLTFPVGSGTSSAARAFLGVSAGARMGIPQVVAIDGKGIIRAQSERLGTPMLQTPDYLRGLLKAMLREGSR